jgi:type II secretory pathway component GspD/PulD (secretin)
MPRPILLLLLSAILLASATAAPKPKPGGGKGPASEAKPSGKNKSQAVFEFYDEDLAAILQKLTDQAGLKAVIDPGVSGPITLRMEDKTPREVIDIIATMNALQVDELKGTLYIKKLQNVKSLKPEPPPGTKFANELGGALLEQFVPVLTKFFDALLDYEIRPETVQKIAQAKKAMLDALMAQGFTREEAFQLLLAEPGLSFFGTRR